MNADRNREKTQIICRKKAQRAQKSIFMIWAGNTNRHRCGEKNVIARERPFFTAWHSLTLASHVASCPS
jgi:CRISPR/Cas system-associated endoribonuclease Cas2